MFVNTKKERISITKHIPLTSILLKYLSIRSITLPSNYGRCKHFDISDAIADTSESDKCPTVLYPYTNTINDCG